MLLKAIQEMVIEVLNCKCEQYDSEQLSISLNLCGQYFITDAGKGDCQLLRVVVCCCLVLVRFCCWFCFCFFVCFCLFLFFKKTDAFCERWDNTREKHTEERPDHSTKCISSQG